MVIWQDKEKDVRIDALTRLVPKKQFDVLTLDCLCREYDGTFSHAETVAGAVPDRHFRSFFMYYEGKRLIGELYIFPTYTENAEITAIVDPHQRRKGIFMKLLEAAEEELEKYGIEEYYFVAEPGCEAAGAVIDRMGLEKVYAELVMELRGDNDHNDNTGAEKICTDDGKYRVTFTETGEGLDAFLEETETGETISTSGVSISGPVAFIHDVETKPELRNRGFGSMLIGEVLRRLKSGSADIKIMLQVRSDNTAAVKLYEKAGFTVSQELDYLKKR
ncbi:MAG: GNAT family N-acetyltransferase [Lachnospiraceae bacterium]|nr:GNAT family N-acetyltransferase [Lachnospiraceae bacterium]